MEGEAKSRAREGAEGDERGEEGVCACGRREMGERGHKRLHEMFIQDHRSEQRAREHEADDERRIQCERDRGEEDWCKARFR